MKTPDTPSPIHPRPGDSPLKLETFEIDPENHAEFKAAALAAARQAINDLPAQLESLKGTLRRVSPPQILAAFASYGMRAGLMKNGEQRKLLPDVMQHHGELLQAIALSLPLVEWGVEPATPDVMQALFDTVPTISNSFFMGRLLEGEDLQDDKEAMAVRSLQERVRMHTHGVRNWGYYRQVLNLSRDLYASLDLAMHLHHGFGASDVIDTLAALVSVFENRQSAHWELLGKVFRGKTPRQLAELYYRLIPDLVGGAEEMLAILPPKISSDEMKGILMAHYDLRLVDTALFNPSDIASVVAKPEAVIRGVLEALSCRPGALTEARFNYLFLDNPVWHRPLLTLGENYFCPMPQMAFSHIHRIMDRLCGEAGLQESLKDRRALYLEQQVEAVFRGALPDADIRAGVKWKKDDQQFETDLLVIIDRVVLIVEAKSHRLTPQGLRGAPDRVKKHIREIVLAPSIQSARLEELIRSAREGDTGAVAIIAGVGIDAGRADRVIRISVTLDDLSMLSACEQDFKKVGWVPQDHALAPSILIADLQCLVEILDNPLLLLHYLSERSYLQKSLSLLGDELDYLGLYLVSGFNLAQLNEKFSQFSPSGMSAPIDRYYEGREAGLNLPKPKMELRPLFRDIVERITQLKPAGWTLIGFHLLSSADPAEQRAIERNLNKLRRFVQKNYRDPSHASTLIVQPPERRKAPVLFYLFPAALRAGHRGTMRQLSSEAVEAGNLDACIILARCTETWEQAFESLMLWQRNAPRPASRV
ncbi:hypothetical protein NKI66_19500 [Mesorhizobium sp. M0518]|uniref:hypothetical protein n=1 Tax=Mesorhizobium sp. M0518 TaxID=2956956 RepID=UPI003335E680